MRFFVGITYKILSIMFFVSMMAIVKVVGQRLPVGEIVFFRAVVGAIPVLLVFYFRGQIRNALKFNNIVGHLQWALSAAFAMILWFWALSLIPLPLATAISFTSPLFMVIMAAFILREKVGIYRLSAVIIGFIGVFIILWPRLNGTEHYGQAALIGLTVAMISTILWSLAQIFIRKLSATESTVSIVISFSLLIGSLSLASAPFGWLMPNRWELFLLVSLSLLGGIGQIFISEAFRYAEASIIAPFDYLLLLFASIIGIIFFNEYPDNSIYYGAPIVVAAGLFVIYREHRLNKKSEV